MSSSGPSSARPEKGSRLALDGSGDVVGAVRGYLDTPWGMWIAIDIGGLYPRLSLAPLEGCRIQADHVALPWSGATVHFASKLLSPRHDAPTVEELRGLLEYYERAFDRVATCPMTDTAYGRATSAASA